MAGTLIAVRGNCDSSRTEELFNFALPIQITISINNIFITLTHGHVYNRNNLPENCGKIFLSGHTHVGLIDKLNNKIIANPGSISKPRNGSKKSYIIIDEQFVILKTLDGEAIKKVDIKQIDHSL